MKGALRHDRLLKRQHHTLWRAFILDIFCVLGAGVGYTFFPSPKTFSSLPIDVLGPLLIGSGLAMVYGHLFSTKVWRVSLWIAMVVCSFLAASVFAAAVSAYVNHVTGPGFGSVFFFLFVAGQLLIQAGEPRVNPASEALWTKSSRRD